MALPISVFIGLRYMRARKRTQFISFISLISTLGMVVGVMALITVLSVMNGFDQELRLRILGMSPHVTVTGHTGVLSGWSGLLSRLQSVKPIRGMAPVVYGEGMLTANGLTQYVALRGIAPDYESQITQLSEKMVAGTTTALEKSRFGIILGVDLATRLGVSKGDRVVLIVPRVTSTPLGVFPRTRRFSVVGVFKSGYEYDRRLAFLNLHDAGRLLGLHNSVSGLNLRLDSLYTAPHFAKTLQKQLGPSYIVTDWTQSNRNFFHAIAMEKTLMFVMLSLVVMVAVFNILSTLVMVVTDKQSEIAILRTLGASSRQIMRIFVVQGSLIGLLGVAVGSILGVALASHVGQLVSFVEHLFHVQLFSPQIYFVSHLPSKIEAADVITIAGFALLMSVLVTIYPAWQAAQTEPAKALRAL